MRARVTGQTEVHTDPAIYLCARRAPCAEIPRIRRDRQFATLYVRAALEIELGPGPTGPEIQAAVEAIRQDPELKSALARGLQGMQKLDAAIPGDTEEYLRKAEAVTADLRRPGPDDVLHVDKAWHVLHFLFSGDAGIVASPAGTLCGGEKVGEPIVYGPARLVDPAETSRFADFLDTQSVAALHRRLDLREMHRLNVYGCESDDAAHEERAHRWVREHFPRVRAFVRRVAEGGDGLLLWLR